MTVTGIVVAKNEEPNIEGCLRSLRWADRILLIDNMSTDRTVEIAARHTDWIVRREVPPGVDPNHDNLNYGFSLIPDGWVLHLDADERASGRLAHEVRQVAVPGEHSGYWVPFRIGLLGRWIQGGYWGSGSRQIRLFRAGCARYPLRAIHETLEVEGSIGKLEGPVYHLPFPTIETFLTKTNRWTTLETDLILNGESPGVSGLGRRAAHPSGLHLLWSPVRLFLWSFFRLGGWREGRVGVATSALLSTYGLLEVLKVWERAERLDETLPTPEEDDV